MRLKDSHHPFALVTVVLWSFSYVFTRLALKSFSPFGLGSVRYAIAALALIAVCVVRKVKPPKLRDLPLFALSGAVGFGLYNILFNLGSTTVTAATSSVVIAIVPVMTALMASFLYKERLAPLQWVAVGAEFCGILILTLIGDRFTAGYGVLLLLAAAVLLSAYNVLQRRLTKTYSSLQASAYSIFFGALMLQIFAGRGFNELRNAPPIQYLYVSMLGVFCSAIAYVTWATAFSKADKTSSVSNYMFLTPLLTGALGIVIAGEPLEWKTVLGGLVILFGVFLFNRGARRT